MKYEHILGNAMDMNDSPTKIAISWYSKTLGGFPIEIKANIWYLYLMMLLSYFIRWNYDNNTKIGYYLILVLTPIGNPPIGKVLSQLS